MTRKSPPTITTEEKTALADHLAVVRKYHELDIPRATLIDLIDKASQPQRSLKEVEKVVRRKLHNLVAPYLGDPQYEPLMAQIAQLPPALNAPETEHFCLNILNSHASTRERMPINREFYQRVFTHTGTPSVILDLACGLNPFALPWMNLPSRTQYIAYDLHLPRVQLIDTFFRHVGQSGAAIQQDILAAPPQVEADVAFFFKEAHRFEQRETASTRKFLEHLNANIILLSLPTETLTGRRSMLEQDRALVASACAGQPWQIDEILFPSEIVFCIRKTP
jgi:16S rRNA (guanine(1405)-N(7))-methyltransferase